MSGIATYVAELDAAIPAPSRTKRDLLREARDGLSDAARAYRSAGYDAAEAERAAVADFGEVAELAPAYRREIALSQVRRTGRKLCATLPVLLVAWHAVLTQSTGRWRRLDGTEVLAAHLAGLSATMTVLAAAALPLAGRLSGRGDHVPWRTAGRLMVWFTTRTPTVVGTAAVIGALSCAGGLAAMLGHVQLAAPGPAALVAGTAVALTATLWSGEVCRRMRRLC